MEHFSGKGKFIIIEGGDGAGKTSQINKLKEIYGDTLLVTREPGGTPFAEEIRNLALNHPLGKETDGITQLFLMWASRMDHMNKLIIPALAKGVTVICDRFDSSTYMYQIFGQQDQSLKELFWTIRKNCLKEFVPDLYVYLEVSPEVGLQRKQLQKDVVLNHFDNQTIEFHKRVERGIKEFLNYVPHVIVDANKDFDTVNEQLKKLL